MEAVFIKVLNMSISACWLILAVILLRLLLKKAPKWISVVLWGLVGLRLVLPFSLQSVLSLIPSAEVISPSIGYALHPEINSGVSVIDNAVNPTLGTSLAATPMNSVNPMQIVLYLGGLVWVGGIVILLLYGLISYLRLRRKVAEAIPYEKNTWLCDQVKTPFILGVFRPRIYMSSGLNEEETAYVLAHEHAHLRRKDHLWKPLGFLLLTVYWFNPLIWVAYMLLCRDIEAACDEKVISDMGMMEKKAYANALVSCSMQRRLILACPLAFGEVGVKERVKGVLNYRKPAFWIIVAALIACVVIAVCFLTNPKDDGPDLSFLNYKNAISLIGQNDAAPYANLYPADSDGVQPGVADAKALAQFLESAEWTKRRAPSSSPEPRGYLEFRIEDDYRIIVYQSERLAAVRFGNDIRYYRTGAGDYEAALATFIPAPSTEPDRRPEPVGPDDSSDAFELALSDPLAFLRSFADAQIVTVIDETDRNYENSGILFDEIVSAQSWTAHQSEGFPASAPDRLIVMISGDWELRIEEQAGECLYMGYPKDSDANSPVIYLDCGENLMDELMAWAIKNQDLYSAIYRNAESFASQQYGIEIPPMKDLIFFSVNRNSLRERGVYWEVSDPSPAWLVVIPLSNGALRLFYDENVVLQGWQMREAEPDHVHLLSVTSSNVTVEPYPIDRWAEIWTETGWLCADGIPLEQELADHAKDFPRLKYRGELQAWIPTGTSYLALFVLDPQSDQALITKVLCNTHQDSAHEVNVSGLDDLEPGSYLCYVGIVLDGRYIDSESRYEQSNYNCYFWLEIPDR